MSRSVTAGARPSPIAIAAVYFFLAAQIARTLTSPNGAEPLGAYVALFALFILLYTTVLWRPNLHPVVLHVYLLVQSVVTLALLSLNPEIDSITALFIVLNLQAALIFNGRTRWLWVAALALLIPISIVAFLGLVRGLAAGLLPMAVAVMVPAIVAANEQVERARIQSERLVAELQDTHARLRSHASQVEELAALEERNRLARELHDSVSQTIFAITLNTRSAQMLLERDPSQVRPQLEQLQALAQNALVEMRRLIAQMRF